jgi:hypothetical protein
MAMQMLASVFGSGYEGGDDLEDRANTQRAPPMPIESVRRVAAAVLKAIPTPSDELRKVEDFLARQGGGMSLYNGRNSFFDILMMVFPVGKPLKVSRAAFQDEQSARRAAYLLSWAATCERWGAEYEHTRRLLDSSDRASPYAALRATQFKSAAVATAKPFGDPDELYSKAAGKAKSKKWDAYIAHTRGNVVVDDPLITLTRQVLWARPLIWHRELDARAVLEDPVILAIGADTDTAPDDLIIAAEWKQLFASVVTEPMDITPKATPPTSVAEVLNATNPDEGKSNLYKTVVYVDGVSLTAGDIFETAINQLLKETAALHPSGPKFKRGGVCPAGQQYVVKFGSAAIPKGPLEAAVRAALRKYGPIKDVSVVCASLGDLQTFKVVPVDGSSVW